ncbi:hypothetical protein HY095_00155 [Candidatus Micrarchaeota archaeon]|nr:hypothetical protein [Candidatus Micrarchaeota archaeon]
MAVKRRGQASWGVMEVLIAVILLGMSMAIVFYALREFDKTKCVIELKSNTIELQNALLDVALGAPPTTRRVVYKLPACGDTTVEGIRFAYYPTSAFCRICPGQFNGCWIAEPTVYDRRQDKYYRLEDASVCINMPANIDLIPNDAGACRYTNDGFHFNQLPCPPYTLDRTTPYDPASCKKMAPLPQTTDFAGVYEGTSNSAHFSSFGRLNNDPRVVFFTFSKSSQPGVNPQIKICASDKVG